MKTPSVEPVLRSRLMPRISFRFMFALMTVAALIAAVARSAGAGGALANAAIVGLCFVLGCFLLFTILFLISWSISSLWYESDLDDHGNRENPFAEGQFPPQILPPRNPRL